MEAIFILLSSMSGICVAIMDRIAHYDNVGAGWFSRDSYHKAKYRFIEKYPKIPKWFVFSVLVMFLDAWHFSKLISVLCFFGLIALYDWKMAFFGLSLYHLYFTIFYKK